MAGNRLYVFHWSGAKNADDLRHYTENALQLIATNLQQLSTPTLPLLSAAPKRPQDGQLVRADGANWDPGQGRGFYGYDNGTWVKLG